MDYLIGLLIGKIFIFSENKERSPHIIKWSFLEIASVVIGFAFFFYSSRIVTTVSDSKYMLSGLYWVPSILLFIFAISRESGIVSRILCNKTIQYFAGISLEFYLVHYCIIVYGMEWFGFDPNTPNTFVIATFTISVVLAWFIHWIVLKSKVKDKLIKDTFRYQFKTVKLIIISMVIFMLMMHRGGENVIEINYTMNYPDKECNVTICLDDVLQDEFWQNGLLQSGESGILKVDYTNRNIPNSMIIDLFNESGQSGELIISKLTFKNADLIEFSTSGKDLMQFIDENSGEVKPFWDEQSQSIRYKFENSNNRVRIYFNNQSFQDVKEQMKKTAVFKRIGDLLKFICILVIVKLALILYHKYITNMDLEIQRGWKKVRQSNENRK